MPDIYRTNVSVVHQAVLFEGDHTDVARTHVTIPCARVCIEVRHTTAFLSSLMT